MAEELKDKDYFVEVRISKPYMILNEIYNANMEKEVFEMVQKKHPDAISARIMLSYPNEQKMKSFFREHFPNETAD